MSEFISSHKLLHLTDNLRVVCLSDEDLLKEYLGAGRIGDTHAFRFGFARSTLEDALQHIEELERKINKEADGD